MSVLIPRTRMLGVRLSVEEYAALEKLCVESGARSISDFARNAICNLVNHANREDALIASMNQHSTQVKQLEEKLESLAAELASLKAGMQPPRLSGDSDSGGEEAGLSEGRNRPPTAIGAEES